MELQKYNNPGLSLIVSEVDRKATENLLPAERKMIEAALQPKINTIPAEDAQVSFVALIATSYTRAGFKMPDESTVALYAEELHLELVNRYPCVTIPEVREALKAGVYGDAGEFTGLNPKTFIQFVRHYLFTDQRKGAVQQFESTRLRISHQLTLSPEQKEADNKAFANFQFELFLSGQLIVDFTPVDLYEFLYNEGYMPLTLDEKRKINERAKGYFNRLKTSPKLKGNAKSIGDLVSTVYEDATADTVKNIAKRIAVLDFFEVLKSQGKTTVFPEPNLLNNV